jgi:hypothetical protein
VFRIIAPAFGLLLTVMLVACGGATTPTSAPAAAAPTETPTPVPTLVPTMAPTTAPAQASPGGSGRDALSADDFRAGLADLSNYQVTYTLNFEGVDEEGVLTSGEIELIEIVDNVNTTRRFTVTQTGLVEDPQALPETFDLFTADGQVYMLNDEQGEDACFRFPDTGEMSMSGFLDQTDGMFFGDLERAQPAGRGEVVSGVSADRYVVTETQDGMDVSGEIWIANAGGYVVRYVGMGDITNLEAPDEGLGLMQGTVRWEYLVSAINSAPAIELPAECANLETTGPAAELPTFPGATLEFSAGNLSSYVVDAPVTEVADFYRSALPAEGWALIDDTDLGEAGYSLAFTRGDATLQMFVSTEAGRTQILVQLG